MKQLLQDNWMKISGEEKGEIRKYLVNYLKDANNVLKKEKQVVKMMILLLAKITKLGWFDDVEIKHSIVPDLTMILHSDSPKHKLIGLSAIDQLIVEMTYMTKMKNL